MAVLVDIIAALFSIYWFILLATALISFVPDLQQTRLGIWLARASDPYLNIFRRSIPPLRLGPVAIDLSWLVAVVVFRVIQHFLMDLLSRLLGSLG